MGKTVDHFPFWWRWWSYISPIRLDTSSSEINENLEVLLVRGNIQLCTEKAVYSYEHKYDNFKLIFDQLDFNKLSGKNILLLGLGLGSVVQLLDGYKKGLNYTAVELDEEVIFLAEKHILKHLEVDIQIVQSDGHTFPQVTSEKYDLICMDIFIDDWIPKDFLTNDFCNSLKSILAERGTVIYNTPAFNKRSANSSRRFYKNKFKSIFQKAKLIDVHKNYMLISDSDLLHA